MEGGAGKWVDNWRRRGKKWLGCFWLEANFQVCEELEPALHSWERGKGWGWRRRRGGGSWGKFDWGKIIQR